MIRVLLTHLFLGLGLANAAQAQDRAPRAVEGPVEARVVKVRDGDTIEVSAFVWPMQTVEVAVRLRGIDAPELRGDCPSEIRAAETARDRLAELVGDGTVRLHGIEGDKYFGRVLAQISTTSEDDLAAVLLKEGLVDRYDGGKRRDWCAAVGASGWGARLLGRG